MPDRDDLHALIAPHADTLGLALVRVAMFGGAGDATLQVMAERPDTRQLTIDDCAELSRRISDAFDALEAEGRDPIPHAYRLEVSSPGIDRPLTRLADYADWAGHEARVKLTQAHDGRKQVDAVLMGTDGDDVLLEARHGAMRVPFAGVASAKLVLTDRLIAATAPLDAAGAEDIVEEEDA